MRRVATLLLCCMAAVFLLTLVLQKQTGALPLWLRLIQAFSEAAMVGAFADWFAVTALFRHPLGLPIPHTAIIPANKARIGRNLGTFIEHNFLDLPDDQAGSPQFDFAGAFLRWLSSGQNEKLLIEKISDAVPELLRSLDDEDLKFALSRLASAGIERFQPAPFGALMLQVLLEEKTYPQAFKQAAQVGRSFLAENRAWLIDYIRRVTPWFIPNFVNTPVIGQILDRTDQLLRDAIADPHHELRSALHKWLVTSNEQLIDSEEWYERAETVKRDILQSDSFRSYMKTLAATLHAVIIADAESQDSAIKRGIVDLVHALQRSLGENLELREKINRRIRHALRYFLGEHKGSAADFVARTVEKWETISVVEKIESYIGKDLQFIRINGTIVGGIVGVLIVLVEHALL